jgi:peptidoglycan/LPS O-acetylase OafA/YrhL
MQPPSNLKPLTSLRFFAAMWVVLYHYWPNLNAAATPALVAKGYLGVELFFTLSGFILCHVYLDAVANGGFRYGSFLWARMARVYPLHLATLVGIGLMAFAALAIGHPVDANVLSWPSLPANLLLVHAWGLAPAAGWNHPSWSISAEWFAYLTFPAFAWAALKLRDRPWVAAAAALAFLAGLYAGFERLTGQSLTHATVAWGALRIVPCFAYGCATYLMWRAGVVGGRRTAWAGALISGAAVLVFGQASAPDFAIVAAFGALILSLASLSKSSSSGPIETTSVYLGEISYSIYMICVPWKLLFVNVMSQLFHMNKSGMPLYAWLIYVAALIPLAALSHHLIERPARTLLRGGFPAPRPVLTSVA